MFFETFVNKIQNHWFRYVDETINII